MPDGRNSAHTDTQTHWEQEEEEDDENSNERENKTGARGARGRKSQEEKSRALENPLDESTSSPDTELNRSTIHIGCLGQSRALARFRLTFWGPTGWIWSFRFHWWRRRCRCCCSIYSINPLRVNRSALSARTLTGGQSDGSRREHFSSWIIRCAQADGSSASDFGAPIVWAQTDRQLGGAGGLAGERRELAVV